MHYALRAQSIVLLLPRISHIAIQAMLVRPLAVCYFRMTLIITFMECVTRASSLLACRPHTSRSCVRSHHVKRTGETGERENRRKREREVVKEKKMIEERKNKKT